MYGDDTGLQYAVSIGSAEGGSKAFDLLDVRGLWVHEDFKEVLGLTGDSL